MMASQLKQLKAELEQTGKQFMADKVVRGQIVMVDLPNMGNSVQCGLRPCIIVSNNRANLYSPAEQIITLSKDMIKKVIGKVDEEHIDNINHIIKESISLF